MGYYVLNSGGYVVATFDGHGQPANSTAVPPPPNAAIPLQFVNGAWVLKPTPTPTPTPSQ